MKVNFNYKETLVLLRILRSEYANLKAFYAQNPDIEVIITPKEYNKILSEAHKEGAYKYIYPIITNKALINLNKEPFRCK